MPARSQLALVMILSACGAEQGEAGGSEVGPGDETSEEFEEEDAVPDDRSYGDDVRSWAPEWSKQEREMLALMNTQRAKGADCGTEGSFAPADPVVMNPHLRCSARVHTLDMIERKFFAHDNPDGVNPFVRMRKAGYEGNHMAENIAAGDYEPAETLRLWMGSDGHCSAIMEANFTDVGIGYRPGGAWVYNWTANFGSDLAP